jgi:O-antigen/teichoic acid export membrane protein
MATGARSLRLAAFRLAAPLGFGVRDTRALVLRRLVSDDLVRNSSYMMASTVITSGLGAVFWIAVARTYRPATVGLAAALISAMMLTSTFCMFGMQASLVDRLPRRGGGAETSATLMAGLAGAGAFAAVGAAVVVYVLPRASARFDVLARRPVYAVAFLAGTILMSLSTVFDYTFVAERCAGKMTLRNTVFAAAKLPLVVVPPLLGLAGGVAAILGSWVAAAALGVATAVVLLRRLHRGYRPVLSGLAGELRAMAPSLPLQHTITIAAGVSPMVLPLFVSTELSPRANAYFYVSWMVGGLFFIISPAVSWSLFAEARRRDADYVALVKRAALVTTSLLAPLMVGVLLFGERVLALFGGKYAANGGGLLTILVVSAIPDAVTNLYVTAMRVRGTLVPAVILNVGMAAATLGLAWVLLRPLGIAGAGWAWLAAQSAGSVVVAVHVIAMRRRTMRGIGSRAAG